jgi:hypothetical protein
MMGQAVNFAVKTLQQSIVDKFLTGLCVKTKVLSKLVPFIRTGNILLLLAQVGCIFWNGCRKVRMGKSLVALSQEGVSLDGFAQPGAD